MTNITSRNHSSCVRTTIMKFNVMIQSAVGATCNGRRFTLLGGLQPSNALMRKGVLTMTILDVVAVVSLAFTALMIGFSIGKNAKR